MQNSRFYMWIIKYESSEQEEVKYWWVIRVWKVKSVFETSNVGCFDKSNGFTENFCDVNVV